MSKDDQSGPNHGSAKPAALPEAPMPTPERSWHGSVNGHAQAVVVMGRGGPRLDVPVPLPR